MLLCNAGNTIVSCPAKPCRGHRYIRLRTFANHTQDELAAVLKDMKAITSRASSWTCAIRRWLYRYAVNVVATSSPVKFVVYTLDREQHKRVYNSFEDGGVGVR